MLQADAGGGRTTVDDLLGCGYQTGGTTSSAASFLVEREKYHFCHVLSAGQVAVYWTHDAYTQRAGGLMEGQTSVWAGSEAQASQ